MNEIKWILLSVCNGVDQFLPDGDDEKMVIKIVLFICPLKWDKCDNLKKMNEMLNVVLTAHT